MVRKLIVSFRTRWYKGSKSSYNCTTLGFALELLGEARVVWCDKVNGVMGLIWWGKPHTFAIDRAHQKPQNVVRPSNTSEENVHNS